jgi:hypothetical protein
MNLGQAPKHCPNRTAFLQGNGIKGHLAQGIQAIHAVRLPRSVRRGESLLGTTPSSRRRA